MIVADVFLQRGERGRRLGDQCFVALPSIGDNVLLYDGDGESIAVTVTAIFHSPKRVDGMGPSGEPLVTIQVAKRLP